MTSHHHTHKAQRALNTDKYKMRRNGKRAPNRTSWAILIAPLVVAHPAVVVRVDEVMVSTPLVVRVAVRVLR